ncbi:glycosyltransferase family 2 protein [Paenibacillus anaericanus]|uniref:Glycosyltransferase family 2 protein n=1 Tax=Paenibacillus anaericanus TaxID=170367 RepID=A0A3S1DW54_9BACL|nr:glycosyltransferase family A protein [Paenibacillus anaericanus]RUT48746.1 glycosyltransferase family 2 protein [Paenibacillus anaericanus]
MVSIICCTMRDSFMDKIFQNYVRQNIEKKEMIIVLNRDHMEIEKWNKKASEYKNVSVYQLSEKYTLGKCLNYGMTKTKYNIVAKFDDDDYYAANYLKESLDALKDTEASIIGKETSFLYFEEKEVLMLYREGGENNYSRKVKGGTLVFFKSVWEKVKFNETKVNGSDNHFLNKCRRNGYKIYSVSRNNYVCVRREDISTHTQKRTTAEFMDRCKLICYTNNYIPLITKD